MNKNQNDSRTQQNDDMSKEKTNQDYNNQKPNPNDPNQTKNQPAGDDGDEVKPENAGNSIDTNSTNQK